LFVGCGGRKEKQEKKINREISFLKPLTTKKKSRSEKKELENIYKRNIGF
jgi:hypothetical protein